MLKFFVENKKEIDEISGILKACKFPVRRKGMGKEDEICFFYNEKKEGISFNAHKIIRKDVPFFAKDSPFLVSVGRNWSRRGLLAVIEGYIRFFARGMPVICFQEMEEKNIIDITRTCIVLPWGGFPQGEQNQKDLLFWIEWAYLTLAPHNC